MIYLISPYNNPDPEIRQERYKQIAYISGKLAESGIVTYSPIAYWHPIVTGFDKLDLGIDHLFWKFHNRKMISLSTQAFVVLLDGWQKSEGVKDDIQTAIEFSKPVEYLSIEQCLHYGTQKKV